MALNHFISWKDYMGWEIDLCFNLLSTHFIGNRFSGFILLSEFLKLTQLSGNKRPLIYLTLDNQIGGSF